MNWAIATCAFGLLTATQPAMAGMIDFDDLARGAIVSNQYAGLGVTFAPNAFSGPGREAFGFWAPNTDMSLTGAQVLLGGGSLLSGNILHSVEGWGALDGGDPSFSVSFAMPIKSVSLDVGDVDLPSYTSMFFYDGDTLLGSTNATRTGQSTLSFTAGGTSVITRVAVVPGASFDYVAVDNLAFVPMSEIATIDFDDLARGAIMSNQYEGLGVTFAPNAFSGPGREAFGFWAPNTDMSLTGAQVLLGGGSLLGGNILHSVEGWVALDGGDPSFSVSFAAPVKFVSLDVGDVDFPSFTSMFFYDGDTLLGSTSATRTGQSTLSFTASGTSVITRVAVVPGASFDYVGVDNLSFSRIAMPGSVPEPATWATLLLGFGISGTALRRQKRKEARFA